MSLKVKAAAETFDYNIGMTSLAPKIKYIFYGPIMVGHKMVTYNIFEKFSTK